MDRMTVKLPDGRLILKTDHYSQIMSQQHGIFAEGSAVDKLGYLEDLKEQGRLMELPCAAGKWVYSIECGEIQPYIVSYFSIDGDDLWFIDHLGGLIGVYGKTVFLSQEMAESAMNQNLNSMKGEVTKEHLTSDVSEQEKIINKVLEERKRQDAKWGEQNHSAYVWASIIGEEYGEMCKAINEFGFDPTPRREQDIYTEAIQTIASCVAMLECMKRNRAAAQNNNKGDLESDIT